jgi:hypothetical protein
VHRLVDPPVQVGELSGGGVHVRALELTVHSSGL